jgi:hypothetical protein
MGIREYKKASSIFKVASGVRAVDLGGLESQYNFLNSLKNRIIYWIATVYRQNENYTIFS